MSELSIVLVTYRRTDLLKKALNSLARAVQTAQVQKQVFSVKTYLCVNGSDDDSMKSALEISSKNPELNLHIKLLSNAVTPAAARNHLLSLASSPFIFFMDDDVELPSKIFIHFLQLSHSKPEVDIWGGPNLTPLDSSRQKLDNGWFVAQPLIVGPIATRYGFSGRPTQQGNQFNLMLCNLFIRREIIGQQAFEVFFKTAEENELIYRLEKQGRNMASSDLLFVWHERRSNYKDFLKQIFYYGYGRGQLFCRVSIKRQKLFMMVPIMLSLTLTLWTKAFWLVLLWLSVLKILYFIQFKRLNFLVLFVPSLMWLCYSIGLFLGMSSMKKNLIPSPFMKAKV